MELSSVAILCLFVLFELLFVSVNGVHTISTPKEDDDDASPFPRNFLFGTASSAYQIEGAFLSDGKGLNNWDVFTRKPGTIIDGSNGDIADDHYHRYLEDIKLMDSLGVNSYRFSISWARILPKGRFGEVNPAGIKHYNNLIDALLAKGIEPFVTLFHYDLPQELEDRYGAWLSPQIQEDFLHFANVCFDAFGDRVKYWVTFNEPNIGVLYGYRRGIFPPGHCLAPYGSCTHGESVSETEVFIAGHNIILSHAAAVDLYRTNYQKKQRGTIGIVVMARWFEPISNSSEDKFAANRALAFNTNWFLDPIVYGKYPAEMTDILGSLLPSFTRNEKSKVERSSDFIGINHYNSLYAKDCIISTCEKANGSSRLEGFALQTGKKDGVFIGETNAMGWYDYPQGMEKIVTFLKERYNNIPMFVLENGYADENNSTATIKDFLNDNKRVNYMSSYLNSLATAIRKGADVRGYFVWSLLDNFEWTFGYTKRFGLYHVDYATLKRTPKSSATWYKLFIQEHRATKKNLEAV